MGIDDLYELLILNYTLEDLHVKGFLIEDLEKGIESFIIYYKEEIEEMLGEDGWLD
jgi:hypothetical protein